MSADLDERQRNIATGIAIGGGDGPIKQSALDALEGRSESGHSRDDALSPRQFEQLVNASYEINDDKIECEARAILYLTGRAGLRKGEVTHLREEWVDWNDGAIVIPDHDPCSKGQHGDEVCGYCRRRAEDRVETNNLSDEEARDAIRHVLPDDETLAPDELTDRAAELKEEVNIPMSEALAEQWQPKTQNSARPVPFDFDVRVELALEAFFDRFDAVDVSAGTVNRRISRLQEISDVDARVYPHALRATAASYHASRDISVHSLMSIMGWADPSTARAYVNANDEQAAREIRSKHR